MQYYEKTIGIDVSEFVQMVSLPGEPHDAVDVKTVSGTKIDSAFIGSCTNGRMERYAQSRSNSQRQKVAPGVILKIVPATDEIWKRCLEEGLIKIFSRMPGHWYQMPDVRDVQPARSGRMARER